MKYKQNPSISNGIVTELEFDKTFKEFVFLKEMDRSEKNKMISQLILRRQAGLWISNTHAKILKGLGLTNWRNIPTSKGKVFLYNSFKCNENEPF